MYCYHDAISSEYLYFFKLTFCPHILLISSSIMESSVQIQKKAFVSLCSNSEKL